MSQETPITNPFPASFNAPLKPSFYVQDVSEYEGKPCVLVFSNGFYYLMTSIEILSNDEIEYDLAVGRPVDSATTGEDTGAMIEWLDDNSVDIEDHGVKADEIIQAVLQEAV